MERNQQNLPNAHFVEIIYYVLIKNRKFQTDNLQKQEKISLSLYLINYNSLMLTLFQKHSHDLRVGIIFNTELSDHTDYMISKAILLALYTLETSQAKNFITKLVKEENVMDLTEAKKTLRDFEVSVSRLNVISYQYQTKNLNNLVCLVVFMSYVYTLSNNGNHLEM